MIVKKAIIGTILFLKSMIKKFYHKTHNNFITNVHTNIIEDDAKMHISSRKRAKDKIVC